MAISSLTLGTFNKTLFLVDLLWWLNSKYLLNVFQAFRSKHFWTSKTVCFSIMLLILFVFDLVTNHERSSKELSFFSCPIISFISIIQLNLIAGRIMALYVKVTAFVDSKWLMLCRSLNLDNVFLYFLLKFSLRFKCASNVLSKYVYDSVTFILVWS